MTIAREAQFTVSLRRRDVETLSKWSYVVTCERCGEDLSADFTAAPAPTIIKFEGLDRMRSREPQRAHANELAVLDAWAWAVEKNQPFIMDMRHSVEHPPAGPMLERAIEDHAEKCGT